MEFIAESEEWPGHCAIILSKDDAARLHAIFGICVISDWPPSESMFDSLDKFLINNNIPEVECDLRGGTITFEDGA